MTEPDPLRWQEWHYINDAGNRELAFRAVRTEGSVGVSMSHFDHWVWEDPYFDCPGKENPGDRLELRIVGRRLYITEERSEPDLRCAVASCELPDTVEELIAWARMTERLLTTS